MKTQIKHEQFKLNKRKKKKNLTIFEKKNDFILHLYKIRAIYCGKTKQNKKKTLWNLSNLLLSILVNN